MLEELVALQRRLRAPGGCPWDREQTHETLRTFLIEEAYEVLDALESRDAEKFAGELGDLLLQVVFHAELAREAGRFDIADVIQQVHEKLVRRHPHVFGNVRARTAGEVLKNWERLKAEERRSEDSGKTSAHESILSGVPRSLPALLEAYQLTRRASNIGFDWENVEGVFDKLFEESEELRGALRRGSSTGDRFGKRANPSAEIEEEVGDLLFAAVNLARFLGIDPEIALKKASHKFKARFSWMEQAAGREGKRLAEEPRARMEELWDLSKQQL
ncbi:MAG: nucleoside triphosphate pyrophosphohydrolase [Candidatus Acidiferrales bacterium]